MVVVVECSALNFLKTRGASWKTQDRFFGSQRFSSAKVAGLRKRGWLLWKNAGTGRVLFTLGRSEVASGHSAAAEELGGRTGHVQPNLSQEATTRHRAVPPAHPAPGFAGPSRCHSCLRFTCLTNHGTHSTCVKTSSDKHVWFPAKAALQKGAPGLGVQGRSMLTKDPEYLPTS